MMLYAMVNFRDYTATIQEINLGCYLRTLSRSRKHLNAEKEKDIHIDVANDLVGGLSYGEKIM